MNVSAKNTFRILIGCLTMAAAAYAATDAAARQPQSWSAVAAAKYLDARAAWWQSWPVAQRDHKTACVSCHTALPYALGRPSLRQSLGESGPSPYERAMLGFVSKRVALWNEVEPFYSDKELWSPKSTESRGTEAVLNALVLANYDARQRLPLSDMTRNAFDDFWNLQIRTGAQAGAWDWLNFHLAPWESNESQYYGATLAALAVGMAPGGYASEPVIQPGLDLLRSYLTRQYESQPLLNKIVLLWASAKISGLLTTEQRKALIDAIAFLKQQDDGGWTLATLGKWKRLDKTLIPRQSDGYATGLTVLALEQQAGSLRESPLVKKGLTWLQQNQDPEQGLWRGYSLNKDRDPASLVGRFMSDAATGFAALALENSATNNGTQELESRSSAKSASLK